MKRARTTLRASDLLEQPEVVSTTGVVYRLGPPKKRNVNLNVVNHCQLYTPAGALVNEKAWYNLTNLREDGFRLHRPAS